MTKTSINKRNKISEALAVLNAKSGIAPFIYSTALFSLVSATAMAQETASAAVPEEGTAVEEVVVTGMRATMAQSADLKRESSAIVDGLVASDVGELPGLSMSDVIENITSVSGHRGKGSASEMSIRGLGPFLGLGTFNGRTVTSVGTSRAVNYKKFPTALSEKVVVYKSQQADLIEGGVAGTVDIASIRPLDYGKRKIVLEASLLYNETSAHIDGDDGLGNEQVISYVDQLSTDNLGDFGFVFGYQRTDSANPEESALSSSTLVGCATKNAAGETVSASSNCATNANTAVNRENYTSFQEDSIYFTPSNFTWRNQEDGDYREGFVAAVQWQPNERWDVNFDIETSDNSYFENRHDFTVADARYHLQDQIIGEDHSLLYRTGRSKMETKGYYRLEEETYRGGGISVDFAATDRLTLSADLSYSESYRDRSSFYSRLGTNNYYAYSLNYGDSLVPELKFLDANRLSSDEAGFDATTAFNPNDPASWSLASQGNRTVARYVRELEEREDKISAIKFDAEYLFEGSFISSVQAGVRYSEEDLYSDNDADSYWDPINQVATSTTSFGTVANTALTQQVLDSCFIGWNNSKWLSGEGGSGFEGGEFAQMDGRCGVGILSQYTEDGSFKDYGKLPDRRSPGDDVIKESVTAAYVMANLSGVMFDKDVTGNVGVRVVRTNINSTGYSTDYAITEADGLYSLDVIPGSVAVFDTDHTSTEALPSANITFYLEDDVLLRGALYRSMSRPNLQDMGAGRNFETDDDVTDIASLITGATGDNPYMDPLMADNGDVSLEWYPNDDTALSLTYYYKEFEANFRSVILQEDVVIDGVPFTVDLDTNTYTDEPATIQGIEITAQHNFNYLPSPFDGFGTKISYNYSDSDFENQDGTFGDVYDANGVLTQEGIPFIEPANLFGYSENVFSGSIYWKGDAWDFRVLYKARSKYFQPNSGAEANRYVEAYEYVDATVSYEVMDNVDLVLQATNILDEAQYMTRGVDKTPTLVSSSGPKYQFGVKVTF